MRVAVSVFFIMILHSGYGQTQLDIGVLPKVVLSTEISDHLSIAGSVQTRLLREGVGQDDSKFEYSLTDLTGIVEYRLRGGTRLAVGYLFRSVKEDIVHRAIQQVSWTRTMSKYRIGHRLRTDQTFAPDGGVSYRLRYRLSVQVPLDGLELDPRELYLKLATEKLHQWSSGDFSTELRVIPALGYYGNDESKIELGADARYDSIFSVDDTLTVWGTISYYLRF